MKIVIVIIILMFFIPLHALSIENDDNRGMIFLPQPNILVSDEYKYFQFSLNLGIFDIIPMVFSHFNKNHCLWKDDNINDINFITNHINSINDLLIILPTYPPYSYEITYKKKFSFEKLDFLYEISNQMYDIKPTLPFCENVDFKEILNNLDYVNNFLTKIISPRNFNNFPNSFLNILNKLLNEIFYNNNDIDIIFKEKFEKHILNFTTIQPSFSNNILTLTIGIPNINKEMTKSFAIFNKPFILDGEFFSIKSFNKMIITNKNYTHSIFLNDLQNCLSFNEKMLCFINKTNKNENKCEKMFFSSFINGTVIDKSNKTCKLQLLPETNIITNLPKTVFFHIYNPIKVNFECKTGKHSFIIKNDVKISDIDDCTIYGNHFYINKHNNFDFIGFLFLEKNELLTITKNDKENNEKIYTNQNYSILSWAIIMFSTIFILMILAIKFSFN